MNTRFTYPKPSIILVADTNSRRHKMRETDNIGLTYEWQVDETVVAITRAAIARGIPLAVPMDLRYAPLVLHVASEYISPEVAEGRSQKFLNATEGDALPSVSLIRLEEASSRKNKRTTPAWIEIFLDLKVVSDGIRDFSKFLEISRPLAIIGVGQGSKINAAFKVAANRNIPFRRLATPVVNRELKKSEIKSSSLLIEQKLIELRKEMKFIPVGSGSRVRKDREQGQANTTPPYFHAYPPLSLYAQLLLENLISPP